MKKILISILMLCTLVVSGCSFDFFSEDEDDFSIVATNFASYDFARAVAEDNEDALVEMLLTPGTDSHSYEPTPQDIIDIQNADVFIYVGGDSDSWVDDILEDIDTSNLTIIKLMDLVEVVEEEIVEGMESDHEDEDEEEDHEEEVEYDEHVWTSPVNCITIIEKLTDVIVDLDNENKEIYESSAAEYISELEEIDLTFEQIVSEADSNYLVFGDKFPFRYFVDEYNLEYSAAFSGCSESTEASASTIAYLIDKVNEENIPVILKIELTSSDIADTISDATGAIVLEFNAGHNISQEEFDEGLTLVDIFWSNTEVLKEALN